MILSGNEIRNRLGGDIVIDPSLPITGVESEIEYLQVGYQRFFGLFGRTDDNDRALLERLSNRLGGEHVRGLRCLEDHRPERAWRLCAPGEVGELPDGSVQQGRVQPPWLLPQPQVLLPRPSQVKQRMGASTRRTGHPTRMTSCQATPSGMELPAAILSRAG